MIDLHCHSLDYCNPSTLLIRYQTQIPSALNSHKIPYYLRRYPFMRVYTILYHTKKHLLYNNYLLLKCESFINTINKQIKSNRLSNLYRSLVAIVPTKLNKLQKKLLIRKDHGIHSLARHQHKHTT